MDLNNQLTPKNFILLCIASYLLAISYGVTFLLPLLVSDRGGNDASAGLIISVATISALCSVILSGHISDRLGIVTSIAIFGFVLSLSSIGFALSSQANFVMIFFGFILGMGWGVFYTLGPILIASMIGLQKRAHYFALLSGVTMAGIGTGPLLGRLMSLLDGDVGTAFLLASLSSFIGACLFLFLNLQFKNRLTMGGMSVSRISFKSTVEITRSNAIFAIIMVGLGGCIFGGLSSFQTTYAATRELDYSLFFIGFLLMAITSRLFLSAYVIRLNPFIAAFILTLLMVMALIIFIAIKTSVVLYIAASLIMGLGYGLSYSVINALAANEAPSQFVPQSLLLFSLSYFIGIFGFPLLAGQLIVHFGINSMLISLLIISVINNMIMVYRIKQQKLFFH